MLTWLSSDVGWPSATLVQHSPDVGLMAGSCLLGGHRSVGLQLEKHILMLGHCLRRLPNFNPSMGLNASCFFGAWKNTCQSYRPHITCHAASSGHTHLHRHRKRWASVTDVGPALIQHWFNALCLLCYTPNQVPVYCVSCLSLKHTRGVQPMLYQRCRRWANIYIDLMLFHDFYK